MYQLIEYILFMLLDEDEDLYAYIRCYGKSWLHMMAYYLKISLPQYIEWNRKCSSEEKVKFLYGSFWDRNGEYANKS